MKEKKLPLTTTIISSVITLALGLLVGLNWTSIISQFGPYLGIRQSDTPDFSSLESLYSKLSANFDGDITPESALEGAKRGLVESAGDPFTYFMSRTDADDFYKDLNGEVGAGIGIELGLRDGWVRVLRTLEDNPARAAGLLAGDIIYKVDGEDVSTFTADKVAEKIRGEPGSEVTVTIARGGDELKFTMTRERINNVSAYVTYKGDVAVLTISRFDADTGRLAKQLANGIVEKGIDKIILDLRGNGGGYVTAARDVASLWVDGDLVVTQKTQQGLNVKETYANRGEAILKGKRTIVLTNGSTASASEIVAGALRDYDLATIIGEKSFGKGSMQELMDLGNGTLLRVTIAHWYTPKGTNIDHSGISPDTEVPRTFDDINLSRDPQLDKALDLLK